MSAPSALACCRAAAAGGRRGCGAAARQSGVWRRRRISRGAAAVSRRERVERERRPDEPLARERCGEILRPSMAVRTTCRRASEPRLREGSGAGLGTCDPRPRRTCVAPTRCARGTGRAADCRAGGVLCVYLLRENPLRPGPGPLGECDAGAGVGRAARTFLGRRCESVEFRRCEPPPGALSHGPADTRPAASDRSLAPPCRRTPRRAVSRATPPLARLPDHFSPGPRTRPPPASDGPPHPTSGAPARLRRPATSARHIIATVPRVTFGDSAAYLLGQQLFAARPSWAAAGSTCPLRGQGGRLRPCPR